MTWYEVLACEPSTISVEEPMAAHLARWWRSKFRNGYKNFSVLAEGERTDTDELLVGRAPSQCSAPPDLLPSEARAFLVTEQSESPIVDTKPELPTHNEQATDKVHFEEFTCDVKVRGGESSGGAQPLHFSFTLYDFDGHGRMTKDDIAGIVSTIYESVGKTVTVPHYGSKTIQVRLTVSPEQCRAVEERSDETGGVIPSRLDQKVRFKRDLSAHVREGRRKPRRKRIERISPTASTTQQTTQLLTQVETVDLLEEERRSRLSVDDDVSDCSERLRMPKGMKRNLRQRQYQKNNLSPRYRNQQNNLAHHRNDIWNYQKENVLPEGHVCVSSPEQPGALSGDGNRRTQSSSDKKRSSSLQRQELLEIIQANMEKNHLSFQTSRKHYPDQRGMSSMEGDSINCKQRHRHRSNTFTGKHSLETMNRPGFTEHPSNGYLDLANTNINIHKESNVCRYDSFLHAVICSSSQHAKNSMHLKGQQTATQVQQKPWKSHHRSRSHDLDQGPFRYTLLEPYENLVQDGFDVSKGNSEVKTKSFDYAKEQDNLHRVNTDVKNKPVRTESKSKPHDFDQNVEALRKTNFVRKPTVHNHCSPHHLKHQNREKYHARAMAQVEKWLENDNNTRLNKSSKKKWTEEGKAQEKVDNLTANIDINDSVEWRGLLRSSENEEGAESGTSMVHRYVHEHIHHHYHHFEDKISTSNTVVV